MLARVRSQELTVEQAWEHGLFCPFGEGAVDFAAVLAELDGFDGWAVVEQDRVAVRVDDLDAVRAVESRTSATVDRRSTPRRPCQARRPGPVGADLERAPGDGARPRRDADRDRAAVVLEARPGGPLAAQAATNAASSAT